MQEPSSPSSLTGSFPLQEKDTSLYRPALEELRRQIRSSTTSMTSVPKPLKFLRPHYGKLKEIYENMAPGENKVKALGRSVPRGWGNGAGAGDHRALWTPWPNISLPALLRWIITCQGRAFATCDSLGAQGGCCVPGCPCLPVPSVCLDLCALPTALCGRHHLRAGHDHERGARVSEVPAGGLPGGAGVLGT